MQNTVLHLILRRFMLICVSLLLLALAFFAVPSNSSFAQQGAAESDKTTVVYDGRILGDDENARLILDLDSEMTVKVLHVDGPDRIVIETNRAVFNLPEGEDLQGRGVIGTVHYGAISNTKSRIVLTLTRPAIVKGKELIERKENGRYRLILDIAAASAKDFAARVAADVKEFGASGYTAQKGDRVRPTQKKKGRFVIVVDPGHGGIDTGTSGKKGTQEKNLTLEIATKLADNLRKAGPYDVYMTREEDVFLTLKQRVAFAQRKQADLFISLHADALKVSSVRGATIYTLSNRASDKLSEQLAEDENRADMVAGLAAPEERDQVLDILAELTTRETMKFSHGFSNILVKNMDGKVLLFKHPQRSAAFGVLKAPEIPGVLIEMGYLSNPRDEKLMQSSDWQKKLIIAVTDAVNHFFEVRMP